MSSTPQPLGLKRSFGFGDRLGLATPGHIDAVRGSSFAPIFAQQSIRELKRTRREPDQVMTAAAQAVEAEDWTAIWGADADHLQTKEDVDRMAKEGYTFFTIDPSAHVNADADGLQGEELEAAYAKLVEEGAVEKDQPYDLYLDSEHVLGEKQNLTFDDRDALTRE